MVHDLSQVTKAGTMRFWPRERLQTKVLGFVREALSSGVLRAGAASKLFGCTTFLGVFGKMGRAGLHPLKERQYDKLVHLDGPLVNSCLLLEALMAEQPRREWYLCQTRVKRFLVASDAALESPQAGTAGFLLVLDPGLPTKTRLGHVVDIPSGLSDQWRLDGWHIAQLEMLMVLAALTVFHGQLRGRTGLWMIDNVAALMALIRG